LGKNHYYPFGLTMAGISDKALKSNYAENKYRYNKGSELENKEFSDGTGLEMYETPLRELDPQVGRWWQIDPLTDQGNEDVSPYRAMNDDPSRYNDPTGNDGESCCKALVDAIKLVTAVTAVIEAVVTEQGTEALNQDAGIARNVLISAGGVATGTLSAATGGLVSSGPIFSNGYTQEDLAVHNGGATAGQIIPLLFDGGSVNNSTSPQLASADGAHIATPTVNLTPTLPSAKVDASANSGSSNQGSGQGRGSNNRKPDPQATGDHTVSDANGSTTYVKNDRNPSGFQEVKRVDVVGSDHGGVPTPHVHIPGQKLPTPAKPADIPNVDLSRNILPPPTH
jgi:RHS repeat-associated protein